MIGSFTTPARIVTIYFIMSTPNTHITSPRVSWPSIPTLESRMMKNYWSHYNLGSGLSQHISDPFLFNIDEDEFHSCRYMYILSRFEQTISITEHVSNDAFMHFPLKWFNLAREEAKIHIYKRITFWAFIRT